MPSGPKMELDDNLMAPELQKYLNRNYWEQKHQENTAKQSTPTAQHGGKVCTYQNQLVAE